MKIYDKGTKLSRKTKPFVDNSNISVRWNATEQVLEVFAPDNSHRHRGGGDYEKRHFHCTVEFTLGEVQQLLSCLGTDAVAESRELLSGSLSSSSHSLLRLLLTSSGLSHSITTTP